MANPPNIKFDLSGTVREVAELNKALESLGGISQNLFSNLGRLSGAFGDQVNNIQSSMTSTSSVVQSSGMTTPKGVQYAAQAENMNPHTFNMGMQTDFMSHSMTTPAGIILPGTQNNFGAAASEADVYRRQAVDEQRSREEESRRRSQQANLAGIEEAERRRKRDAVGIGMSDVAGFHARDIAGGSGKAMEDVSKSIDRLTLASESASDEQAMQLRQTADILKTLSDRVKMSSEEFADASKSFSEVAHLRVNDPRRQEAEQNLLQATGRRQKYEQELASVNKEANKMAGGDDDGTKGSFFSKRGAALLGGAAMVGVTAYSGMWGVDIAKRQAAYGAELTALQEEGATAASQYQDRSQSFDFRNAENLFRETADMLYEDKDFKYIGVGSKEKAGQAADRMTEEKISLAKSQRDRNLFSGALETGASVLGAGAAGAIAGSFSPGPGNIIGAAIGVGGALANKIPEMIKNYDTDPYSQLQGSLGADAKRREEARYLRERESNKQEFQRAELDKNREEIFALQQFLDLEQTEKYTTSLVGAARGVESQKDVLNYYSKYGDVSKMDGYDDIQKKKKDLQSFRVRISELEKQGYNEATDGPKSPYRTDAHYEIMNKGKVAPLILAADNAQRIMQDEEAAMESAYRSRGTKYTKLDLTPAEYMAKQAELKNAMGKSADITNMVKLSSSGLGSWGSLMGNLSSINTTTGGGDADKKLESVLARAVSLGFDESRTAQGFVSSTLSLAESMKARDIKDVASTLSTFSRYTGANIGVADELSVREAAQSMASYNESTKTRSGVMGAHKMLGLMGAGEDLKGNIIAMSGMGAMEIANSVEQLDSGNISSPKLRQMIGTERAKLREQGVPASKIEAMAIENVKKSLGAAGSSISSVLSQSITAQSSLNLDEEIKKIEGASGQEKEDLITRLLSKGDGVMEGGSAGVLLELRNRKVISPGNFSKQLDKVEEMKKSGHSRAVNKSAQKFKTYTDSLMAMSASKLNEQVVSSKKIESFFGEGGKSLDIGGETFKSFAEFQEKFGNENEASEKLKKSGITNLDLALASQTQISPSAIQRVYVTNFDKLTANFSLNPNSGNGR